MSVVEKVTQNPVVAHILRSNQRYTDRLGMQFSAAITYFSVLSLVPILMFAFAVTGFVLTVARPDLIDVVRQTVTDMLGGGNDGMAKQISDLVNDLLSNWRGVGVVALASSVYTGASWAGNLKSAVRAQWRRDMSEPEEKRFIVVEVLINLAIMLGLLVMIVVTFALSSIATQLADYFVEMLGLQAIPGIGFLSRFTPIMASVLAGWLLFAYLFTVLPQERVPFKYVARGALVGSVVLGILQYLTSFLFGTFNNNKAVALFGPVIVVMLFLNLFAQLILRLAAWIATSIQPVRADEMLEVDKPLIDVDESLVEEWNFDNGASRIPSREPANPDSAFEAYRRRHGTQIGPDTYVVAPEPDPDVAVPQDVAAKAVKVSSAAGYVVGSATGIGIGAVIAGVVSRMANRRRR